MKFVLQFEEEFYTSDVQARLHGLGLTRELSDTWKTAQLYTHQPATNDYEAELITAELLREAFHIIQQEVTITSETLCPLPRLEDEDVALYRKASLRPRPDHTRETWTVFLSFTNDTGAFPLPKVDSFVHRISGPAQTNRYRDGIYGTEWRLLDQAVPEFSTILNSDNKTEAAIKYMERYPKHFNVIMHLFQAGFDMDRTLMENILAAYSLTHDE